MSLKNHSILSPILLLLFLLLITVIFMSGCSEKKKSSPPPAEKPRLETRKAKWYVQFSVKDQHSTAYTEEVGAPLAANGKPYFLGGIAVHPRYPVQYGGDPRIPLLPYGTVIYPDKPIKIQGDFYNALTVMDTGDVDYGLWENHPYWFDVYYGSGNYWANQTARMYGTPLTSYSWYEEWR